MPSFPECTQCEFRDDPVHFCHAMRNGGHKRFCQLAHDHGRQDVQDMLRRETLQLPDVQPIVTIQPVIQTKRANTLLPDIDEYRYMTTRRLIEDTKRLEASLPADIDLVIAIPRSGLLPGSIIAYSLHTPLFTITRDGQIVDPGHGSRIVGHAVVPKHILLIDDTVAVGSEMRRCKPIVQAAYPDTSITCAAIYANPIGEHVLDRCIARLPGRHFLEWNWANSGHVPMMAFDFDGVLCRDCLPDEDDAGVKYSNFLATASPLHLPRKHAIPLIVTGRHARYEKETRDWMARHRITCDRLVMRTFDLTGDFTQQIAGYKSDHYRASSCDMFIESDYNQADLINKQTGKMVICPATAIFPPATKDIATNVQDTLDIKRCTARSTEGCGCGGMGRCGLGKGKQGVVYYPDCLACIRAGESKVPGREGGDGQA